MSLLLLGALVLVGAAAILARHQKASRPSVVIGEEIARAAAAEQRRERTTDGESAMPAETYDVWRGERSLLNLSRIPLDSALATLCHRFAASEPAERAGMRRSISMDEFYTLLAFSERAALFAMREGNLDHVRDGLTAVAMIERERIDPRDALMALSLMYHAAVRIGCDTDGVFRDAAALAEPAVATLITGFAARRPEERDLRDAFGYDEVETESGVGLIGWEFQEYRPTIDLKPVAIEIAELLEADQYLADVSVATELPRVWLQAPGGHTLDNALRSVRAGATISGQLRPAAHPSHESQQLSVFLVELSDEENARLLLDMSRRVQAKSYSALGVAAGPLFCLVVARSFVQEVASYETPAGLARFAPAIDAVLARHVRKV